MNELPSKIKLLDLTICGENKGQLLKQSQYEFRYMEEDAEQKSVGLLMPPSEMTYRDSDLFPVMDQNLPEGDLYYRLRQLFPKQPLTAMHLLALAGSNGIGRLGYEIPDAPPRDKSRVLSKKELISTAFTPDVFNELVRAYLSTGSGIAGIQPKIMVPTKITVPIPDVIVKTASEDYPGLAANEYVCLYAAKEAGISVPEFALSDDGHLLLLDRFDITERGNRLGFEDIASIMGLRVRDTLSDRKYQGSYQNIAEVLKILRMSQSDLERFYTQIAFSIMVRNGDGHLKNFAVVYDDATNIRLAPMFDVVTTKIYRYHRYSGGPALEDNTMALKLFSGKKQGRGYPVRSELIRFGQEICHVKKPDEILERIAQAMHQTLQVMSTDERIPPDLLKNMKIQWLSGIGFSI